MMVQCGVGVLHSMVWYDGMVWCGDVIGATHRLVLLVVQIGQDVVRLLSV